MTSGFDFRLQHTNTAKLVVAPSTRVSKYSDVSTMRQTLDTPREEEAEIRKSRLQPRVIRYMFQP